MQEHTEWPEEDSAHAPASGDGIWRSVVALPHRQHLPGPAAARWRHCLHCVIRVSGVSVAGAGQLLHKPCMLLYGQQNIQVACVCV